MLSLSIILVAGCREQIAHSLTENETNRMISRLAEGGIEASRERQSDGRWTISVKSSETREALRYINANRLLREDRPVSHGQSSMLSSREEQRFSYERSLSRELEATVTTLDGVLDARVHLNLPPLDPLLGQPLNVTKGTASVLIVTNDKFSAQSADVAAIISGASGVPLDAVSVLVSSSRTVITPPSLPLDAQSLQERSSQQSFELPVKFVDREGAEVAIALLIVGIGLLVFSRSRKFTVLSESRTKRSAPTRDPILSSGGENI